MSAELMQLVLGFQASQAIHTAAALGIPDLLAGGPRTSDHLAEATASDSSALYRLLRALASLGVLEETDGRLFSLAPLGEPLRSDVPGSLHGWAVFVGRPYFWRSWGNLEHSIRTGETSFRSLYGTDVWEWRAGEPEESAIFDRAMMSLTAAADNAILDAYDFGRFRTIVDVGGGNGTLLASLLGAHLGLRGVVFDQPQVVAGAETVLRQAGVLDRCSIVGGSFFDSVPESGDAYVLKAIIHDWDDEEAVAILRVCRAAMGPGAKLLLIERDLGRPNDNPRAKLSDLNMLVMPGGRERSTEEYARLFEEAGLRLVDAAVAADGHLLIEAVGSDA